MSAVEFWFEFASTYSYPAALRIDALAQAAGKSVVYKPFLLGPLFAEQGLNDSPFNVFPVKGRYMWRDLERLCQQYGLGFRKPSVFPRNGLLAARVALLGSDAAWGPAFVRAVYEANFVRDLEISSQAVIAELLASLGLDAASVLERAASAENKARLREQTEQARARGIFGAPSFVVDDELFWGNDRLESALSWSNAGSR